MPLPAKSTINRYIQGSKTGCGFDASFFELFETKLKTLNERDRHGIISFDEMSVRTSIEVDLKTMTFSGLQDFGNNSEHNGVHTDEQADHALVFMFSSLSLNFHQPIGYFGAKGPTKSVVLVALLTQAIISVEKAGGKVEGIVSDGAQPNRKTWTEFGISGDIDNVQHYFQNPYDENRRVYAFSDAPHLIKCIRNRLASKKFLKVIYLLIFIINFMS